MPIEPLVISDKIYGKTQITSFVIIELINSKVIKRLKGIGQFGVPNDFYHLQNYSRYDHSIGVFLILRKLGASEEEQIAGLLHDISHTAFSHVIDWVIGDGQSEDYQDSQHKKYISKREISRILKKYNYHPQRILDHRNFPLLEQEIPKVCADRIDYSLHEFSLKTAKKCFKDLTVMSNQIVFKSKNGAILFANSFLKRNLEHWAGYEAVVRYRLFANVLRIALQEKIIEFSDFKKNDNYIVSKLLKSQNQKILKILQILRSKPLRNLAKGNDFAYKKFRHVDPLFIKEGKIYKLSEEDKKFKEFLHQVKEVNERGIRLPKITALQG
jgi:uncharacterized protein